MSAQLPVRDLEWISAYLDKVLSLQEREAFEARLQTEPKLAEAVTAMEHTRALLRRIPQRRVPRSFVLGQSDLPERRMMSGWNAWNLVSAVATLMLVLVFAGDIWANGLPIIGGVPAAEAFPQVMMAEAPTETSSALGGGVPEATATPAPEGDISLFSAPADESREAQPLAPSGLRQYLADYAKPLEVGFFFVAIGAGFTAWWRRRRI